MGANQTCGVKLAVLVFLFLYLIHDSLNPMYSTQMNMQHKHNLHYTSETNLIQRRVQCDDMLAYRTANRN